MRKHSRAATENTFNIDQAVRVSKPFSAIGGIDSDHLHISLARDVPEPEPVTWRDLNGRVPEAWEEAEIVAARTRERRAEWRP